MFHRFALAYPTLNRLWMDSSQSFLAPRAHITVLFLRRQVGMSVAAEQSLIRFWSENPAFFLIVADLSKERVASLYVTCINMSFSNLLAVFGTFPEMFVFFQCILYCDLEVWVGLKIIRVHVPRNQPQSWATAKLFWGSRHDAEFPCCFLNLIDRSA